MSFIIISNVLSIFMQEAEEEAERVRREAAAAAEAAAEAEAAERRMPWWSKHSGG